VTASCENSAKQVNALCRKNVEFLKDEFTRTYIEHWASVDLWVY
jgi:hypothetical protein